MRSKPVMLPLMRSLCRVRKRSMTVLRMRCAKNIMPETVMERLYFGCGQRPRCALSVLCVCLGSKAACLPASRDGGDDASQRIEVARVNDFAWRMRITQRPGDGHVDGSVAEKRGAVVAASGDAILRRDVICPSQRHHAVHQLARGEIGVVHRAGHEPFAKRRVGKALGLERGI